MVRTKANNAARVAAGSKIPKKSNYVKNSPVSSPTEKGKDNLPVNRYFPRETPIWQKKITFFYDRDISHSSELSKNNKVIKQKSNKSFKRSSSELEDNDIKINENESCLKRIKINDTITFFKERNDSKDLKEFYENESMELEQ